MNDIGLTITEVAALYGLTLRSLRFYEEKGLLSPVRRGLARYYTTRDCIRIELIMKGRKLGFSINEIERLIGHAHANQGADGSPEHKVGTDLTRTLTREEIASQIALLEDRRDRVVDALATLSDVLQARDVEVAPSHE